MKYKCKAFSPVLPREEFIVKGWLYQAQSYMHEKLRGYYVSSQDMPPAQDSQVIYAYFRSNGDLVGTIEKID